MYDDLESNIFYTGEPTFRSEDILCTTAYEHDANFVPQRFLSHACLEQRRMLLSQAIFSIKPYSISDECWTALKCMMCMPIKASSVYFMTCGDTAKEEIINKTCPDIIYIPAFPIIDGHVYLVYDKNNAQYNLRSSYAPKYACSDDQLFHVVDDNQTFILFNKTCRLYNNSRKLFDARVDGWLNLCVGGLYSWIKLNTVPIYNNFQLMNNSILYKCLNWPKYISKRRIFDGIKDCYYEDDEQFSLLNKTCLIEENSNYF